MAKKKQKTERREPYVTDEQIRSVLDRAWARLRAQRQAPKGSNPRRAAES